nr:aminopeptidase N-like [Leptinotarsa decemlineata]XP_023013629.1 aminopeptidase N-like [Leptinotarsa decemlineata]
MGRGGYHSNRLEFLSDETILQYNRNGGCFVTTKKAIAFVVFALASLITVVLLMYYYGPKTESQTIIIESNDIEQLLNDTLNEEKPQEELRLPKFLYPIYYRLRVYPLLDENNENNFTFTGHVQIQVNCTQTTDRIVLHWDDLNITDSNIRIYTTKYVEINAEPLTSNETKIGVHNISRREVETEKPINLTQALEDDNSTEASASLANTLTTTASTPTNASNIEEIEIETTESPVVEPSTEKIVIQTEQVYLGVESVIRDNKHLKLKISMSDPLLSGGTYTIDIKYSGDILDNLVGLYKTSYKDLSGNEKWLATTHFQPVYARRVFPCFDEPNFKAPFEISVARRTNMTVLSNMPLKETEPINGTLDWVWDHFHATPPMSTYLVGFTISDMKSISPNATNLDTVIKVWAPEGDLSMAQYALDVTLEVMEFMEDFFGMKYPLPKLDMLAVPNFGKAAMENWGLISFRKSSILFDPMSNSIKTRSFIMAKIAHELAHQWFGNLVTMDWWSDLWLNEGFGTFISEVAITSLRPKWHAYSSVKIRDTYNTLYYDSLKSTHSIQTEVSNIAQIEQMFDAIIYQKGSSILKMLNSTLTQDVFKRGLQQYLKKYAYQTATQDDLWSLYTTEALNQSLIPDTVTVKALMNSWTLQSGYPFVTISRDYASGMATINQTKMTEDANITSDESWYIPITYLTKEGNGKVQQLWLENIKETSLDLKAVGNDSWILLNIDETGFYRVNYDSENWKLLIYQLRRSPGSIPVANRGQLIDDAFHLADAGYINYTIAFDLVKYLYITEPNYIPWYSALRNMEDLRDIISNYEYSGLYDNFLLKLVKPMFNELTTEQRVYDTQNEKLLRLHIVTSACKLRYGKCISWARNQYFEWMQQDDPDSINPISVDYRYIAQCTAIKSGGPLEWDFLWNRTLSPSVSSIDLQTAYLSLGCSYDPWLINRYLEYSLSGNISLEYVPYVWQSISHSVGVRTGFQFLRLNWDRIYKEYEEVYLVLSSIFHDFIGQLSTEADLEDLTTFYKLHQNDLKSIAGVLQSTVDRIKVKINWKTKHLDSVVNWLRRNRY